MSSNNQIPRLVFNIQKNYFSPAQFVTFVPTFSSLEKIKHCYLFCLPPPSSSVSKMRKASLLGQELRTAFLGHVTFLPLVSSPKQIMLVLSVFYCHWFARYTVLVLLNWTRTQVNFQGLIFVFVIVLPKQTTLVLALFFSRT